MNYLLMFLLLGVLVFLHEFGHLVAAKACGIPLTRFSVGLGRKLWGVRLGGTEYCVSLFPFGGYVLPALPAEELQDLPVHRQVIFALGGPLANIIAAVVALWVYYCFHTGFPFAEALFVAFEQTGALIALLVRMLPTLLSHPEQAMGLIGAVEKGGEYVGTDIQRLLEIAALLNLNLAVFNLLPILPLDGGRIVMAILQRLYAPFRCLQMPFALAGWALLLALMAYTTIMDISRLAVAGMA